MGFRVLVSRHPAIQTTELLTLAPAGLSPAEHPSLYWTHNRTCSFPAYGLYGTFFVKGASRHFCRALLLPIFVVLCCFPFLSCFVASHFCRALLLHSFVRPTPRAFFHPDRTLPSPSR